MASMATACRISARLAARGVCRRPVRNFSSSSPQWAAHNFAMPAMSPTMQEGNITSWRVKEGDSFSAGDVLLEIETDKAQMDVEAQDDGIVAKIIQPEGSKSVAVGTRIAVFADPDDDISSLEIPAEEPASSSSPSKSAEQTKEAPSEAQSTSKPTQDKPKEAEYDTSAQKEPQSEPQPSEPASQPESFYPFYPSVEHLLHEKGLSSSEASKITATGPNGRLLKGDVLAYVGEIDKNYSSELSKQLSERGHLDLTNIKKAEPKKDAKPAADKKQDVPEADPAMQVAVPVSFAAVFALQERLQQSLGTTLPLSTFIARASEIANEGLPNAKRAPTSDELFDSVLGVPQRRKTSKGHYLPQITALPPPIPPPRVPEVKKKTVDVIDILAGRVPKPLVPPPAGAVSAAAVVAAAAAESDPLADNVFSVTVQRGEERRARVYLERVKSVLEAEPGRCVL